MKIRLVRAVVSAVGNWGNGTPGGILPSHNQLIKSAAPAHGQNGTRRVILAESHVAAQIADKLVTTKFKNSITRGFAAVGEPHVAVCLLPGTEIAFDENVECEPSFGIGILPNKEIEQRLARFRQINKDNAVAHHEALEFPDGQVVLVTRLCVGQRATVLQLPASVRPEARENQATAEGCEPLLSY